MRHYVRLWNSYLQDLMTKEHWFRIGVTLLSCLFVMTERSWL